MTDREIARIGDLAVQETPDYIHGLKYEVIDHDSLEKFYLRNGDELEQLRDLLDAALDEVDDE